MRRAVQRFLPAQKPGSTSSNSVKKGLNFDKFNLVQDFYIELDEPHKSWNPGDHVTGIIVLDLKKNIVDINISLTLVGFIKIKQSNSTTNVRNKPHVLFNYNSVIYGQDNLKNPTSADSETPETDIVALSKGEHRFPFSVRLPKKGIYTSISFEKGTISYLVRASLNYNKSLPYPSLISSPISSQSGSSFNDIMHHKNSIYHCDRNLSIIVQINVARIPKPQTKTATMKMTDKRLKKTISSTSTVNSNATQYTNTSDNSNESNSNLSANNNAGSHPVKLSVDLPASGFLRGELIPLKIKVEHHKPIQVSNGIIVTLIRLCRVDNDPETPIQCFRKDLCQTLAPLYIDPNTLSSEISTSLRVPADAFPTIVGSPIVTFQYYVEVLANISSKNVIINGANSSAKTSKTKFSHTFIFNTDSEQDIEISKSELGMVNVDKLKRVKHFLGLNTEIIVGTDRIYKDQKSQDTNDTHNSDSMTAHEPRSNNLNEVIDANDSTSCLDCSIIGASSHTSISPLSIGIEQNPAIGNQPAALSMTTEEVESVFPEIPEGIETQRVSEKEAMRLREEALLPSEPPVIGEEEQTYIPAPSYTQSQSESHPQLSQTSELETHAPIISSNPITNAVPDAAISEEDKNELERRRLQDLESEPPQFDYVPEYDSSNQESSIAPQAKNAIRL